MLLAATGSAPASAEEILVFAAASTADALTELGAGFQKQTGHRVRFSFGASSDLARQILAGAPADVFLSADPAKMDRLQQAGLVRGGQRFDLLSNQLVVVVPAAARQALSAPGELKRLRRIAIAEPSTVPAGIYAKQWLESLKLWEDLEPKLIPTLDVRSALAAVEAGSADAGIVYASDAAVSRKVRVAILVPRESGPAIVYPVAPIAKSKHPAAALDFVKWLRGPTAQAVFIRRGFLVL